MTIKPNRVLAAMQKKWGKRRGTRMYFAQQNTPAPKPRKVS